MIGGQGNQGVLYLSGRFKMIKDSPQLVIALFDQSHVGGNGLFPSGLIAEGSTDEILLKSAIDWMRINLFRGITIGWEYVTGLVHSVIGRRDDVGPMGLDVRQMAQPLVISFLLVQPV